MKKLLTFALLSCGVLCSAQDKPTVVPFNGIVTDALGKPIKGARIYVVSDNFFAKSDKKGRFGLTNVHPTDTLHVRYHKEHYDIPINGRRSIRIHLGDQVLKNAQEDMELVDFGYGFVKRREHTIPSNGITGEMLQRTGQTNLLAALNGLVPGLTISTGRGNVQATANIRGKNTLYGSTEPLYVVDGVTVSSLDYINIYDVESVEVLKDGSIYGSQGANGAILVHTKH